MKSLINRALNKLGYKISKLHNKAMYDVDDPFRLTSLLLSQHEKDGIFFDVGANSGQTIDTLRQHFPSCKIFAFEPGHAFKDLKRKYQHQTNTNIENLGIGAEATSVKFYNNSHSDMSSVLPLDKGWGSITEETEISLTTINQYCRTRSINKISLLKCDTQGYELEVLKGAEEMLSKTHFILLEVNFAELYSGQPSFSSILEFLSKRNFRLIKLFGTHYDQNYMTMTDALFANTKHV